MGGLRTFLGLAIAASMTLAAASASAQDIKHYRFAHDQQLNSGYSVAYDIFSAKLKELSKSTMLAPSSGRSRRSCNW
jgi:TRAP-type transport system periplasmic protein